MNQLVQDDIIHQTRLRIKSLSENESSGHDWWHIYRVYSMSKKIALVEGGNPFIIALASLLHDIADHKFHHGNADLGWETAQKWLRQFPIQTSIIDSICTIIKEISFKGAGVSSSMSTLEGKIVQDADRLDAIGAIGIARTFAYGGYKNRVLYDPQVQPVFHTDFESYKKSTAPTLNHFYEKLLLLKDLMNTDTAKKIAVERHEFMQNFLEQFYAEWDAKA